MINIELPEAFEFLFATKADDGNPVRYRAAHGGRGGAKSHSIAQALVVKGRQKPLRIGCFREIQLSIRDSVKKLLDDKIESSGMSAFYTSIDNEIRGQNGTSFVFRGLKTLNADAIKSLEGLDIAWIEEANRVSKRSWDILRPTVRKDGSEIWASWNPEEPTDPVDEMFRGEHGAPPGSIVRAVQWHDNPWFSDVMKREMEWDQRRDPDKYAHIWMGGYRGNSETRVFRNWRAEAFVAPSDAVLRFGADWGFAIDPTVLVRCYLDGRTLYIDYEAYMVGCEIDDTPQLFDAVPWARRSLITADSARPETVSYMTRSGFKMVPAVKGPGSIEDGIEFLKSCDIVVHPRCQHVIDELKLYSYKTDPLTAAVLPQLADKDNHTIDALRYALEGARRAKVDLDSVPKLMPTFRKGLPMGGGQAWMGR